MLELPVLGLLKERSLHGYELKRRLAEYGFWRVSFGSLYPALRRLERAGYVTVESAGGRRKVYAITAEGEVRFKELLEEEVAEDEEERAFRIRLAFFRYLDPESRLGVLEQRRAFLVRRAATTRKSMRKALARTRERMDRYTLALMEHGAQAVEADIAWLDELIESERASLHPMGDPGGRRGSGKARRPRRKDTRRVG
ncbi:MAG: PadR family transcriptional regulator [Actinomycetota bacterium]|nr:PadR family transcriptional regulator [Actinomycetota bacterium]